MAQKVGINTSLVVVIGIVSVIMLVAIVAVTHGYFLKSEEEEFAAKYYGEGRTFAYPELREQQAKLLEGVRTEATTSPAAPLMPIEKAMAQVVGAGGKRPATQPSR